MPETANSISIYPSRIVLGLTLIATVLIVASVIGQLFKYVGGHQNVYNLVAQFYLGTEDSVPAYFSSLLLGSAALLAWLIAVPKKKHHEHILDTG